ncbi:MAG: transcription termination factor NusA [Oscillospiraceae bacterium]|nr:transcription termination factor NusA [Oscillospiraceae bacterium]MBR1459346.1 transcription termination factor NusA [Oscillospiraceae bacterium]
MANQKKKSSAGASAAQITEFFNALEALGTENSVEATVMIEKVKSAMQKAAVRMFPDCKENIRVDIDPPRRIFRVVLMQEVVDFEPSGNTQIFIDRAKLIDPDATLGTVIEHELDITSFGRASAQSAKQSIKGDLRDISRDRILEKFEKLENDIITATVTQIDPKKKTVTLVYDKTELYLMPAEQVKSEMGRIREGMQMKVYVTKIANRSKKPIIKLSRVHKGLVRRLFELEVPEIHDRTVEIKSISREPGSRSKIAVVSHDPNVDAVGACIGPQRSRILAVVNELGGEKIDVIPYSEDLETYIANALSPAEVKKVYILPNTEPPVFEELPDGERRERPPRTSAIAVVPFDQLSLAIGNGGQNAKLAAKLTECKIDIKSDRDEIVLPQTEADDDVFGEEPAAPESAAAQEDVLLDEEPAENVPAE